MSSRDQGSGVRGQGLPSRRDFVRAAGIAALFPTLFSQATGKLGEIGIQLFTVREALARDPAGTLARLAAIGFQEVEFAGYPPGTPQALRELLDRNRLQAPSAHVALRSLQAGWDATLDQAAILGHRFLVVPSVPQNQRQTPDDWKRVAALFNQGGEAARRREITFCYHNHEVEFEPLDGVVPYDLLLAETDPRVVSFEMDLYWTTRGGKNPLDYFAKWPGRFPLVHVKDMDATPRRFFADVGKGSIDFRAIFRKAKQAGIRHYFYEQDETPGDPFASARSSYDYLRSLTF